MQRSIPAVGPLLPSQRDKVTPSYIAQVLALWLMMGLLTEFVFWARHFINSARALLDFEREFLVVQHLPDIPFWSWAINSGSGDSWERKVHKEIKVKAARSDISIPMQRVKDLISASISKAKANPPEFRFRRAFLIVALWPPFLVYLQFSILFKATWGFWSDLGDRLRVCYVSLWTKRF